MNTDTLAAEMVATLKAHAVPPLRTAAAAGASVRAWEIHRGRYVIETTAADNKAICETAEFLPDDLAEWLPK